MDNLLTHWLDSSFPEVSPLAFYRGIFPAGELERKGERVKGKYTGIIVSISDARKENGKRKVYRYTLTDDLEAIEIAVASNDFCLCSPISYAGKNRTAENARMMYAIAIDVDKVRVEKERPIGLINLWERHIVKVKRLPQPTYIVSSGSGIHLYYLLELPIPLFRDIVVELQEFKRELTRLIWHDTIVNIKSAAEVQQEGIYQGFRMPGTITKNGGRARAFLTGEKVSMEYLNSFVDGLYKAKNAGKIKKRNNISLNDAKEKYPDWYERRIIRGEKTGVWAVNRNLYDWWKCKILSEAQVGHRYYCVMMLVIYAKKCSYYNEKHNPNPVTRDELEKDCFDLLEHMESLTTSDDNHFGEDDILDALEAYNDKWITYPRAAIEYRTAIQIPANKRNGRDQLTHLKIARAIQAIVNPNGEWRKQGGRKSKRDIVQAWRDENPDGSKAECIRQTGLAKMTVYKHWE